jgi:hypothetical protein
MNTNEQAAMTRAANIVRHVRRFDAQNVDHAAIVAMFLQEAAGSIFGRFEARMTAADQRALFGKFLGKGVICIDGKAETVSMRVKVCFGLDCDYRGTIPFRALAVH